MNCPVEAGEEGVDGVGDFEIGEVEGEAFGVAEVEEGGGFVDVVGVVEGSGEDAGAFEDNEGRVVASLAEVEAEEEVVEVGAEGRAEVHGSSPWG